VKQGRDDLAALVGDFRSVASPFRADLEALYDRYAPLDEGEVASYIPELAKASPGWFGLSVVTVDGTAFDVGDHARPFTIQSVSKPFVYGLALEQHGREVVLERVGTEPTGDAFNSIIKLDERSKRPHNPMVNAGAISVTGLIRGAGPVARLQAILDTFRAYCGREVAIDAAVFVSEKATGHRNRAIAHLMLNFGMIDERVDENLDLYFQQCSILTTCHDLAVMAATLANGGVNPLTGQTVADRRYIQDILSVMLSCGMYDSSGSWIYEVGLPAKSGVSGAVLAVVPGRMGIAVYSPPLDPQGNSVRGVKVCQALSREYGLHLLAADRDDGRLARALSGRLGVAAG
jgi:glutaminase